MLGFVAKKIQFKLKIQLATMILVHCLDFLRLSEVFFFKTYYHINPA